jgi:biopolymer transport protein TolR
MARFTVKPRSRPVPQMNVTPLVDVVLVLLIIFMIVIPSMEHDAAVDLPSIFHVDEEPEGRTDPITVSLTRAGDLYLESDVLPEDALLTALTELHESAPRRRVILRADSAVHYGEVRHLFAECQHIGFPGVSLRVGERSVTPEPTEGAN